MWPRQFGGLVMKRLVFIDDDKTELDEFSDIVKGKYQYRTVHWPGESEKLFKGDSPDIFVSDLYLPPQSGDTNPTDGQRSAAAKSANQVGERFSALYASTLDDKARLKETMKVIGAAFEVLEQQWRALGQHPDHGIELLTRLKSRHPGVPVVFYSRKITPKDVIRVLRAGAVDAIQKGALTAEEVLVRLQDAQKLWLRKGLQQLRKRGLNVNVTLVLEA